MYSRFTRYNLIKRHRLSYLSYYLILWESGVDKSFLIGTITYVVPIRLTTSIFILLSRNKCEENIWNSVQVTRKLIRATIRLSLGRIRCSILLNWWWITQLVYIGEKSNFWASVSNHVLVRSRVFSTTYIQFSAVMAAFAPMAWPPTQFDRPMLQVMCFTA